MALIPRSTCPNCGKSLNRDTSRQCKHFIRCGLIKRLSFNSFRCWCGFVGTSWRAAEHVLSVGVKHLVVNELSEF